MGHGAPIGSPPWPHITVHAFGREDLREFWRRTAMVTGGGEGRALGYGARAVGIDFNPSGDIGVAQLKELYAKVIDLLHGWQSSSGPERKQLLELAIREAQGAQMWAVKAATWRE